MSTERRAHDLRATVPTAKDCSKILCCIFFFFFSPAKGKHDGALDEAGRHMQARRRCALLAEKELKFA